MLEININLKFDLNHPEAIKQGVTENDLVCSLTEMMNESVEGNPNIPPGLSGEIFIRGEHGLIKTHKFGGENQQKLK